MLTTDRLAVAALRGVLQELEGDPAGARAALVALLAPPPPVVNRDLKPANVRSRSSRKRREPEPDAEVVELLEQLVAQHGSQRAVARACGMAFKQINTWLKGRAHPTVANLRRLRAALEVEVEADEGEHDQADEAEPEERTEAQTLVAELVARYGDIEAVATSTGFGLAHLRAWAAGRTCSPRAIERLRDAVNAPRGKGLSFGDKRPARGATPAAAPEAAAGEDDADDAADDDAA